MRFLFSPIATAELLRPLAIETSKKCEEKTFCDVLPSNVSILLKIKDEAWGGMFVDLEESSPLPNKSVLQLHVMKDRKLTENIIQ